MRDWELVDSDRFSFEDSDRFEEDSLCSWISEPESLCNNWRGWKKSNFPNTTTSTSLLSAGGPSMSIAIAQSSLGAKKGSSSDFSLVQQSALSGPSNLNLVELSARCVASHIPFELVERFYPPVPEQLQLRIAFWSFPEFEEDIRLYSCLANGSAEEFGKGERLFKSDSVSDILQIGFHLSATVKPNLREAHKVAVTFDRRRITSCTCTCNASINWCGHIVAVCLSRIFQSKDVTLRAPVSESLSRLHRDQLQKFAQYLISELPQQILPTAQRLLDELLSSQRSAINTVRGAPDPTAGASANDQTSWFLDERTLHGNIHKILIKFCVPAPIVFSDVNYLTSAAPPASAEWSSLLRPLRGREPEGMWNLLSIVREMFRREDRNAVPLLEIITEECLNCDQILVWWFNTKVAMHNGNTGHGGKHHSVNSNAHACQHAGSSLCDEIVLLWRLAALNPELSPDERFILHNQFKEWHLKIVEKISKSRNASVNAKHANSFKNDVEIFPGFRPSLEACYLNWDSYPIPHVTFSEGNQVYHCPFMFFRHSDGVSRSGDTGLIHSSHAILNNPSGEHHLLSSATVSSASKRPRSVDFGTGGSGEGNNGAGNEPRSSTSNGGDGGGAGPSRQSKGGRNGKKRIGYEMGSDGGLGSMIPCMSASGLKIKGGGKGKGNGVVVAALVVPPPPMDPVVEPIEEEAGPSTKAPPLFERQVSADNRSSVSSEGFCENEVEAGETETETSNDRDEGVEICEINILKLNVGTESRGDEFEEADSDSSLSGAAARGESFVVSSRKGKESLPAKFDSSDSQQSGDEYQLYYYDPTASSSAGNSNAKKEGGEGSGKGAKENIGLNVFSNLRRIEDEWEVLFARAEGLHAHGHSKEACKLGVKLAEELLAHPPDLSIDLPHPTTGKGKRKKINPISHHVSCLASATLAKCGFLCTVLAENSAYFYLAFQIGMFGLELARPPASTKPLEVKLANQEAELAQLLKRIPIGSRELLMIRQKAESLRNGSLKSRGEALLPLVLANFLFDALAMPNNREGRCSVQAGVYHLSTDETLGFEAAVTALGLKANVSEADHPLLCEGTRRQRGDLALSMLLHYKDDSEKLSRIMDKLLDREIHMLCKFPLPAAYYSNNPPTTLLSSGHRNEESESPLTSSSPTSHNPLNGGSGGGAHLSSQSESQSRATPNSPLVSTPSGGGGENSSTGPEGQEQNSSSTPQSSGGAVGGSQTGSPATPQSSQTPAPQSGGRKESGGRYKGKRSYPVLPNQPSEAGAHFMFELGKIILSKAGGSSNQSLFTQPANGQNQRGPHRALHMCAFHIGLYALGLHNAVSSNWLSRTYSSHVSWITGQAMEIGAPAIVFLIETWDAHLTPTEAATIADRASRGDVNMVKAASELALSCLPYAHALNPNELHRAILQCKEQSDGMLEKACVTVESAAKGGGVCPEVLFDVARQWFSLYQKHLPLDVDVINDEFVHHDNLLVDISMMDPMNPNCHHPQLISAQTGLPVLNPNNPPPPTPSVSNNLQGLNNMEQIRMQPQQDSRGGGYTLPYPTNFPYIQANYNPVPMAMYPQVIYQPSAAAMNAAVAGGNYFSNGHGGSHGSSPGQVYPGSSLHQHPGSLVSAGPSIQYYTPASNSVQVPISSASNGGHLRQQQPQFYPLTHMSLHQHHHGSNGMNMGSSQGGSIVTPSHVAAVMAASGMHGHGHMGPHLVTISNGGGGTNSGQPLLMQQPQGAPMGHQVNVNRNMGSQPQMNCNQIINQINSYGPQIVHNNGVPTHGNGLNLQESQPQMFGREPMSHQPASGQSALKMKYLLATYRVGMLAMESLARSRDDRPTAKFSRNPMHGEDIKWILQISRRLGAQYVQQFCICAMQSITNPFTLHEIILDAASISSRASLAWFYQNPRSPLAPLVQKCQQMYFQCLHQKLYHITASEYDDFVSIVCTARQAFNLTPDGVSQFKEWLQNLRRSKACKKDLWSQITQALQSNSK